MPLLSGLLLLFGRCFVVRFVITLLLVQELDAIEGIRLRSCGFLVFSYLTGYQRRMQYNAFVLAAFRSTK